VKGPKAGVAGSWRHGYAVTGSAAYDKDVAEQHWDRLLDWFGWTLRT